ncbi:putative 4-coumarate--CoA ligase 1 [Mycena venus]|uniref:Putative 4-coumarate--CoA ligase 1 n=1 Tax=Mycena venus TaxID=2733690 RepID=A0A8H7CRP2_9AGAR|nr:putative 4-coumarate--CoA ligase 1 [Mycena venus]
MHFQSPFPPLPPVPETNVCDLMFGRPDQGSATWPDYTIHIEEKTGRKRTYKELVKRIALGATALGAPVSKGGLGLSEDGDEIIGLLGR